MNRNPVVWETGVGGIKILRLWAPGLEPEWPRVLILDLTAEQFREFQRDVLAFSMRHDLFPDQPMRWVSCGFFPLWERIAAPSG